MSKWRNILTNLLNILAGVSFLLMVALTIWQVITRYVFQTPSVWSEELVSYLFAWASLFGACLITGERGHMNIPVVIERLSPTAQKYFGVLGEAIALFFSLVILFFGGVKITRLAMGQLTSSLGVPVGVFYFILPFAGILNALYALFNIVTIMKEKE